MKYLRFIMIGLAFIFLIYVIFVIYQNITKNSEQAMPLPTAGTSRQQWETKTDDRPPVAIKVTPIELGTGKGVQEWKFYIAFDTHSGSLDQDVTQIATLVDGTGNIYEPIGWEGAGPGGHHREGVLVFGPINQFPQSIELKIRDAGGIPERSFKWDVNINLNK